MKVYVQGSDGEELELGVLEPDPPDGTYTVMFGTTAWLRIVPEDTDLAIAWRTRAMEELAAKHPTPAEVAWAEYVASRPEGDDWRPS
jgi:hypothetical protein